MVKLRRKHNKKLIILIPAIALVFFLMLLVNSYASFRFIKVFSIISGNFNMNAYTLSYNVISCSPKTIYNNQTFGTLCTPATPSGYTFDGWYLNNTKITSSSRVRTTSNITLTARFITNCASLLNQPIDFSYNGTNGTNGSVQEFLALCPGYYQVEAWGAEGIVSTWGGEAGKGGYAIGTYSLNENDKLYITVGGQRGYNGGGAGSSPGGGATHVATTNRGLLYNYDLYRDDLLIVAGGGGGAERQKAGSGGGYFGGDASQMQTPYLNFGTGGSQNTGGIGAIDAGDTSVLQGNIDGSFGLGGNGNTDSDNGPGGGGGYFGGGAATRAGGGGGGSGYIGNSNLINKHMHCYDCATSSVESTKTTTNTCHLSTPTPDCAKEGNGHVRITYLGSATGTKPTFTAKNVQSDYVYLTFTNSYNNNDGIGCFYGTNEAEVNTLGVINNNICRVPSNAAYAKVCVIVEGEPICSLNKKLAEYVIKDGILNYPFTPTVAEVVPSQGDGYYHVAIGNNGRLGLELTGFDASLYNSAFVDLAYTIDAIASSTPGISFSGYGSGNFFNNDGTNRFLGSSIAHLESSETPTRVEQPRAIYPAQFSTNTSNFATYGNSNIGIGKNNVTTNECTIDIYNMWFQLSN